MTDRSGLHVVVYGQSLRSAFRNGTATYFRGILSAMYYRGHRITFVEPEDALRARWQDIPDPLWTRVCTWRAADPVQGLEQLAGADVVAVTASLPPDRIASILDARPPQATTLLWDVGPEAALDTLGTEAGAMLRPLVGRFDAVISASVHPRCGAQWAALGARQSLSLPIGLDPSVSRPGSVDSQFAVDLAFMADRCPLRERAIGILLDAAAALPARRFLIAGDGWDGYPVPTNVSLLPHVPSSGHNAFNSAPRAVLHLPRPGVGARVSSRFAEALGAGACLVTLPFPGLEDLVEPDREVLVVQDADELARAVSSLDECRAGRIGAAGRARALVEHTTMLRAAQLEALLLGGDPSRASAVA